MELYIKDEGIKDRVKYSHSPKLSKNFISDVLKQVFDKLDKMMAKFGNTFPSPASKNLAYEKTENTQWTSSFYTGMLWLAYELSSDIRYKELAEKHIESFKQRLYNKIHIDTHDLGFLYTLSCVSAYKITKNEVAKQIATDAAKYLSNRYWEKAGIIQAWGKMDDKDEKGRIIIDCMMNLPLLYWAWKTTGDKRFFEIAYNHAQKTAENIVRNDASTYHTFYFDVDTGKPLFGKTHQGYSDDSCWARGQAWGIYGFVLSYTYTKQWEFIEVAKRLLNYYLNRLPDDYIPYWDLKIMQNDEPRDSSAAAICACGILEMLKILPLCDEYREIYENALKNIMFSLSTTYLAKSSLNSDGLLIHGVYNKPAANGVDEHCIWGDYFYFEALVRLIKDWVRYW